jgi:hypothetical protein
MESLLLALRLGLAALLYAFLGAVLLMLWRDLRGFERERPAFRPRGQLVVVEVPPEETEEPAQSMLARAFPLQPVTSIGRSPSNTVVIPDTYASSQHALITWREGQWWLEDRESRNGTRLNGQRIQEPRLVTAGDVIGVGKTKLRVEIDEA